jgi:hypothetical protein
MSQLKVNSISDAAGANGNAITLATDGTCTAKITNNLSNRRININGSCNIAQRGTVTGLTSGYGGPDRYKLHTVSHGTYTASQELDAPDGFDQSLKILCTTADTSIASTARLMVQHKIEKNDLIRTKKGTSGALALTVQFWVKSNKTGTYIFEMWDNQNNRHISSTYAISSADTWEKKTMTFAGDTGGNAFVAANTSGLDCNWWLAAGSNFTSGSLATSWTSNTDANRCVGINVNVGDSGNWYMTGFQIETGDVVTDFEYRSYGDELARCQRYLQRWNSDVFYAFGRGNGSADFVFSVPLNVPLRASPSISQSVDSGSWKVFGGDYSDTSSGTPAVRNWQANAPSINLNCVGFDSIVDDIGGTIQANFGGNGNFTLSSEL